ncbi:MAG: murein L,D-transpeptidase catalytic domain family protein [Candidatus Sphingomonas colombiensis]|nr:murein L,D-transpeptidase catalytic domain family protein [Sphingomonas sp.]WEK43776.1 MAG: murein L,D-transpeptidase catalytic domain family protein [Sphingomonas sp.]
MSVIDSATHTRRGLLKTGGLILAGAMLPKAVGAASLPAMPLTSPRTVNPELMRRALAALERHGNRLQRDRMAIVDFSAPSAQPRFHFIDLASGASLSKLVAHGSGSDPAHTGFLHRFSNQDGSNASSEGAFLASDYYVGKHGRSQRLIGLDPTNNNALARAIVVHGAWYANRDMINTRGMLGRSQGCFAVGEHELAEVFERLGPGRMIYAAKV